MLVGWIWINAIVWRAMQLSRELEGVDNLTASVVSGALDRSGTGDLAGRTRDHGLHLPSTQLLDW